YLAKRLAGLLTANIPGLRAQVNGHFVFSRVVLSSADVQLFVRDPRAATHVLRLNECADEMQRTDRLQPQGASIERFRTDIVEHLVHLGDRPKVPRHIADYQVLETLPSSGVIRSFRAQHVDGGERVLKIV